MSEKSRLDEIKEELKKLDISPTIFARKEIRELPDILSPDEPHIDKFHPGPL